MGNPMQPERARHVRIDLIGDFGLTDETGAAITLRGGKARALLAILARSENTRRSRRWIEQRLWSDRAPEQAGGSLRQALTQIRRALGDHADLLRADRDIVAMANIISDLDADPETARQKLKSGREFLENVDVRDAAFDEWRQAEHSVIKAELLPEQVVPGWALISAGTEVPPFVLQFENLPTGTAGVVSTSLGELIGQQLAQHAAVEVYRVTGDETHLDIPDQGLSITIEATKLGQQLLVHVSLVARGRGRVLWSRSTQIPLTQDNVISEGAFPQLVYEAVEAAQGAFGHHLPPSSAVYRANALMSKAVSDAFSFDSIRLQRADEFLSDASTSDLLPPGLALAWRGLVRQIMLVERTETEIATRLDEAEEFARRSVEVGRENPVVLALAAQVRIMLDADWAIGAVLAQDAVTIAPGNPMAHAALASVQLRRQNYQDAGGLALRGATIATNTKLGPWMFSLCGLAALADGNFEKSIGYFERCYARAPSFRSPMRHLIYLYLSRGETDRAIKLMNRLKQIEPDFCPSRLMDDVTYPVNTLRRTNLIQTYTSELL